MTEANARLPGIIDQLEGPLARLGLDKEAFTIRMTGCPNGCARPYNADIGLVGQNQRKVYGFRRRCIAGQPAIVHLQRLGAETEVQNELISIFAAYKANRQNGETLGGFCTRVGRDQLEAMATAAPKP